MDSGSELHLVGPILLHLSLTRVGPLYHVQCLRHALCAPLPLLCCT